jgi:hypothetical protein
MTTRKYGIQLRGNKDKGMLQKTILTKGGMKGYLFVLKMLGYTLYILTVGHQMEFVLVTARVV